MIRAARARHRIFWLLSIALPGGVGAALMARPEVPTTEIVPTASFHVPDGLRWDRIGRLDGLATLESATDDSKRYLRISPLLDPQLADALVYWTEDPTAAGLQEAGGSDAFLLGSLMGAEERAFLLPDRAELSRGAIAIYSLAHREIVSVLSLEEETN